MDEVSGVKFGGKEMSREKAEMRVRSGNEHTHTPRTYTHAAILFCLSTPFFPYLGVGDRPTFLRQPSLLSSVVALCLGPRITRHCCCLARRVIARNKILQTVSDYHQAKIGFSILSAECVSPSLLFPCNSDVKTRHEGIPNQ
jgi:hypothetical protein